MTKPDYTHIVVVADRSGSMQSIKDDMNGGIREFLREQASQPGELTVSVVAFDTKIEEPFVFMPAQDVIDGDDIIQPRGGTALHDAIGRSITSTGEVLAKMDEDNRPEHVIVLIITDGQENASREWTGDGVKKAVTEQTEKYGWEFVFLGANLDAVEVGGGYGIPKGSTITFAANAGGTDSVLRGMSGYVSKTRSGKAAEFSDEDRAAATEQ